MRETQGPDLSLKRAVGIIHTEEKRIENLAPTVTNAITRRVWNSAKGKFDLPIYTYSRTLLEGGINEAAVAKISQLLANLKVDVSDPFTSSSELSVILGFVSSELLGVDLSPFRKAADQIRHKQVEIGNVVGSNPTDELIYTDDDLQTYERLAKLRRWGKELVLSPGHYSEISRQVLEHNNDAFNTLAEGKVPEVWQELGVDPQSKAVLFFRDLKTYAGDVDFYYWGPEQNRCTLELSRYFMSLGYKVDHRSNILIDSLVHNEGKITNGFLGAYLYMYFIMGKSVEFNGDSFENRYASTVLPVVSADNIWPTAYKSVAGATRMMENVYQLPLEHYPGFKDVPFRLLTAVLMGLSMKHKTPFTLDFESFLEKTRSYLDKPQADGLKDSFYYLCQVRNLYQIITERRWEMLNAAIIGEINRLVTKQGGESIGQTVSKQAQNLQDICQEQFGQPQTEGVLDLTQSRDEAGELLAETYKKVGARYKILSELD